MCFDDCYSTKCILIPIFAYRFCYIYHDWWNVFSVVYLFCTVNKRTFFDGCFACICTNFWICIYKVCRHFKVYLYISSTPCWCYVSFWQDCITVFSAVISYVTAVNFYCEIMCIWRYSDIEFFVCLGVLSFYDCIRNIWYWYGDFSVKWEFCLYIKLFKATECCCLIFTACKHIYKESVITLHEKIFA